MQMRIGFLAVIIAVGPLRLVTNADLIFDNGGVSGQGNAFGISGPFQTSVSTSFSVSDSANLTGIYAGLWTFVGVSAGNHPVDVEWAIGISPFATDISSGRSSVDNTLFRSGIGTGGIYDVFESTFPIHGAVESNKLYWLTLTDFNDSSGDSRSSTTVSWDRIAGPSATYFKSGQTIVPEGSVAFRVYGDSIVAVPEPSSLTACIALAVAFGLIRSRRFPCTYCASLVS
jgi:hypothetical protein